MKPKPKELDPLKELLKEHGAIAPSEGFSLRLMNAVVTSYKFSYSKQYRKQERLGKWIILVLIACSLLIFVELKPSILVLEMIFPVFSFAVGLVILIFMLKKIGKLNHNSERSL
ncbi:hypothetical protein J7E50_19435 [Pedobacter sp. ISL-68]|uniref:hypothetical protein n=1 Tax=unclassified Pedobacter TaxID=2628915 RepID=UPI001BE5D146|nr:MULTISPECIES: hypothetical protein [unclassified Pedobacter]MBT2564710.1 hypothetical protein [Pedobacter sp. ISL-64]MBT2592401.1 hypothetical protein [Pedobacter sp. ISL-68]